MVELDRKRKGAKVKLKYFIYFPKSQPLREEGAESGGSSPKMAELPKVYS
jgi:hypothetical protein